MASLVGRVGAIPRWPSVAAKTFADAMRSDKKTHGGKLRFVLSPRIGEARTYEDVPLAAVERVLRLAPAAMKESGKLRG